MTPKVSFIVPCRDKAKHVASCVRSVLAQTYSPMEIVLSDQGSTDGTLEIIKRLAADYDGPNTVRVIECPDVGYRGMAGLNVHLNWIHTQIDGDLVINCAADDLNAPARVERTVQAWKEFHPSFIGTCVEYHDPEAQKLVGYTAQISTSDGDGWVDPVENITKLVGSSASSCWARDLWDKYAPLIGIESQDVLLPFFATLERGLYYISEPLHAYLQHADVNNTGLTGVLRAAKTPEEDLAAREIINFHVTSNWFAILRRCQEMKISLTPELEHTLCETALTNANMWAMSRDFAVMNRVTPITMRV